MFSRSPSLSDDDSSLSLDGYASEASSVRGDEKSAPLPERAYNYLENLSDTAEARKLASYVRKYQTSFKRLPLLLKPIPRQFFPALGEVDALLKIPPPDGSWDPTGTKTFPKSSRGDTTAKTVFCDNAPCQKMHARNTSKVDVDLPTTV